MEHSQDLQDSPNSQNSQNSQDSTQPWDYDNYGYTGHVIDQDIQPTFRDMERIHYTAEPKFYIEDGTAGLRNRIHFLYRQGIRDEDSLKQDMVSVCRKIATSLHRLHPTIFNPSHVQSALEQLDIIIPLLPHPLSNFSIIALFLACYLVSDNGDPPSLAEFKRLWTAWEPYSEAYGLDSTVLIRYIRIIIKTREYIQSKHRHVPPLQLDTDMTHKKPAVEPQQSNDFPMFILDFMQQEDHSPADELESPSIRYPHSLGMETIQSLHDMSIHQETKCGTFDMTPFQGAPLIYPADPADNAICRSSSVVWNVHPAYLPSLDELTRIITHASMALQVVGTPIGLWLIWCTSKVERLLDHTVHMIRETLVQHSSMDRIQLLATIPFMLGQIPYPARKCVVCKTHRATYGVEPADAEYCKFCKSDTMTLRPLYRPKSFVNRLHDDGLVDYKIWFNTWDMIQSPVIL